VTLDGYFDRGYTTVKNSDPAIGKTKGLASSAGTTTVGIKGVEDLGGGLKVGFSVNTDWSDLGGMTQDGSAVTAAQAGTFANSQSFIEVINAKIGTLRMGSINNEILTATTGVASPAFSTGIGSAYSSSWSVHNGYGTGKSGNGGLVFEDGLGATKAGSRGIRQANTIKYISPKVMDVTVAYGFAPKNSTGTGDTAGVTEMSIRYQAGPVDVMYASIKYEVGTFATAPAQGSLVVGSNNTHTMLGASYAVLPTLKLHAGSGKSKASDTAIANSSSTQFGVTYTMGAFDIMAQTAKVDDKNTTAYDRKMTGLGVNYNLSKTTRAYVRYDNLKLNDGAATAVNGDSIKRTAIGVSRSF